MLFFLENGFFRSDFVLMKGTTLIYLLYSYRFLILRNNLFKI